MKASFLRDAIPLVVAAALAIFAICWSFTFKEVPPILIRGFQPGAFPRLVAGLILILSVLAWIEITRAQPDDYAPSRLPAAFWQSMLVLAIFTCLLMIGDLLFALMIATAGLSFAWGERRIAVLASLGIVAPVLVFLLFDQLFQVRFPRGFLIDLYYG